MPKLKFKTPYDGQRYRVSISFLDENGEQAQGRTHQEFKDECDVNLIIPKYDRTGLLTHLNEAIAQYGDYSEVNEFQESMNLVISATENFMQIPSNIRQMFNNDPGQFFEFATNPANNEKMIELGLATPIDNAYEKQPKVPPAESTETGKEDKTS